MIFENKWKQFLLQERIEKFYQEAIKKFPEIKRSIDFLYNKVKEINKENSAAKIENTTAAVYFSWMVKQFVLNNVGIVPDGNMSKEEALIECVRLFESNKRGIVGSKNIVDYKFESLKKAISSVGVSNRQKAIQAKQEGVTKLYESNLVTALLINNMEASCLYGANTKWCTAGEEDNRFDVYNKDGYQIIIIPKNKPKEKFQITINRASGEVTDAMDPTDTPISVLEITKIIGVEETQKLIMSIPFLKEGRDVLTNTEEVKKATLDSHNKEIFDMWLKGLRKDPVFKEKLVSIENFPNFNQKFFSYFSQYDNLNLYLNVSQDKETWRFANKLARFYSKTTEYDETKNLYPSNVLSNYLEKRFPLDKEVEFEIMSISEEMAVIRISLENPNFNLEDTKEKVFSILNFLLEDLDLAVIWKETLENIQMDSVYNFKDAEENWKASNNIRRSKNYNDGFPRIYSFCNTVCSKNVDPLLFSKSEYYDQIIESGLLDNIESMNMWQAFEVGQSIDEQMRKFNKDKEEKMSNTIWESVTSNNKIHIRILRGI